MKIATGLSPVIITVLVSAISACTLPDNVTLSICENTNLDSQQNQQGFVDPVRSHETARYGFLVLPRRRLENDPDIVGAPGDLVTIDYMVHESASVPPAAVVILIAGGNLGNNILPGPGDSVSNAGLNFLVRSAHLFLTTSPIPLRVITIDRPSDYKDDIGDSDAGYLYDGYRTSMRHTIDLSAVINAENAENLPVFLAGTSRGATSTVANYMLAAAVSLSSPATSGPNGRPVREDSVYPEVRPSRVTVSAHVLAHIRDACPRSTPVDSLVLVNQLASVLGDGVFGGFVDPNNPRVCGAFGYHGYMGIESCAVSKITGWMGGVFPEIPDTRPLATAISDVVTNPDTAADIDLNSAVTPAIPAPLTFSLPHVTTALGGTIALADSVVTYTPPAGLTGKIDAFVYIVEEAGGGSSHQVVSVRIN